LLNPNGRAIGVPYGSKDTGTKINSYGRNGEENQRWQFQEAGNTGNRYDRSDNKQNWPGRYDSPAANGQRDRDRVYFDNQERMYKMDGDGVCFYRDRDFRGESVCATFRTGRSCWNSSLNDIGSVRFFGRATAAQVFDKDDFRGNAVEITGDEQNFNRATRGLRGGPQSRRAS
jgi:hypothetical protein